LNERQKKLELLARPNFKKVYDEHEFDWEYVYGIQNKKGDVVLTKRGTGKKYLAEEKALSYYDSRFPGELIQDLSKNNGEYYQGNLYTTEACVLFVMYPPPQYTKSNKLPRDSKEYPPYKCYRVRVKQCLNGLAEAFFNKKCFFTITNEGYGETLLACIPWEYLIERNIAKLIKEWI